jgi:hypothetical protein
MPGPIGNRDSADACSPAASHCNDVDTNSPTHAINAAVLKVTTTRACSVRACRSWSSIGVNNQLVRLVSGHSDGICWNASSPSNGTQAMTDCALATGIQRAALNIYGRGPIRKVIDMDRTERFFAGMTVLGMICLCAAFTIWMLV